MVALLFVGELLLVNDELNNTFIKYDRYMSYRAQGTQQQTPTQGQIPQQAATATANPTAHLATGDGGELIDFGDSRILTPAATGAQRHL